MSGEAEQAGGGESARKKEKQENCDQPIRRQQWSVHDGMHRFRLDVMISDSETFVYSSSYLHMTDFKK